jgi:hypothetical protein
VSIPAPDPTYMDPSRGWTEQNKNQLTPAAPQPPAEPAAPAQPEPQAAVPRRTRPRTRR